MVLEDGYQILPCLDFEIALIGEMWIWNKLVRNFGASHKIQKTVCKDSFPRPQNSEFFGGET